MAKIFLSGEKGAKGIVNIAFFLIPKSDVACISLHATMRQALEKMEHHHYTAVPLLDQNGRYVGTLTEGDLLWAIKERNVYGLQDLEKIPLSEVERHFQHEAVSIYENIEALLRLALDQNFVPVVDDEGTFIGIVTRKAVIEYFAKDYLQNHPLISRMHEV